MAVITRQVGSFGESVILEIDYDDAALLLLAVRCINATPAAAWVHLVNTTTGRERTVRLPPGTTEVTIGTKTAQRMNIGVDAYGRITGLEWQIMFPEEAA